MVPSDNDKCEKCGHSWGAHQRDNQGPFKCRYSSFARHQCGCSEPNPIIVARDRNAAAAWNLFMGRS